MSYHIKRIDIPMCHSLFLIWRVIERRGRVVNIPASNSEGPFSNLVQETGCRDWSSVQIKVALIIGFRTSYASY
jgi:hypothetical protein